MATRLQQRLKKLEERLAPTAPKHGGVTIYDPQDPPEPEAEGDRIDGPVTYLLPDNGRGDAPKSGRGRG